MIYRNSFLTLVLVLFGNLLNAADLDLDYQRKAMDLSGVWQVLVDHADELCWKPEVSKTLGPWKDMVIPSGNLMPPADSNYKAAREVHEQTQCVWIKRQFEISAEQAKQESVLKWGGIRFGASVWINGSFICQHAPISPHQEILPKSILKPGNNTIVIKVPGWGGVPKSKSGYPLLPIGGASQSWGARSPAVPGDIWLEFYDAVYVKEVYANVNIANEMAQVHFTLQGNNAFPAQIKVEVEIFEEGQEGSVVKQMMSLNTNGLLRINGVLDCKIPHPKLWSPQSPNLYRAQVRVIAGDKTCDDVSFQFGMREITIKNGHFSLNGKPLWLRGSNMLCEWRWGETYNQNVVQYLVEEARGMNLNVFRTHTQPPPTLWARTANEHGMMFMAEMPLLYNHADFKYTDEELSVLHQNAKLDAAGWIHKLRNHPSIIMWVISNESIHDNKWEATEFFKHVKQIDPSRPIMRTGEDMLGTPDIVDVHTCFNVVRGAEGDFHVAMKALMDRKDPKRPLCNTEYMNRMWDPSGRWLGRPGHSDFPLYYAECNMEHTELMRRLKFDCVLPYMYAGWTKLRGRSHWRDDYATPMAASLHSSMAPVLASLDLFDRNFKAGQTIRVPIDCINELNEDVDAELTIYVTPEHPLFIPEQSALDSSIWRSQKTLSLKVQAHETKHVDIPIPKQEGQYYLAAVIKRAGDTPVVSQRVIRSIDTGRQEQALRGKRIFLLGGRDRVRNFFKRHQCVLMETMNQGYESVDCVVIDHSEDISYINAPGIVEFLKSYTVKGGRVVVMPQTEWRTALKDFVDCNIGWPSFKHRNPVVCSRAHRYSGVHHPIFSDIPTEFLWRWNGLPGAIGDATIQADSPALAQGNKLAWISNEKFTAMFSYPIGKGEVLFNQLHVRHRIDPSLDTYDPVAERLMVNLISAR